MEEDKTKNEAAIREVIYGFVKAIRAKDINGVMSVFSSEVISFDFGPQLQHVSVPADLRNGKAILDLKP